MLPPRFDSPRFVRRMKARLTRVGDKALSTGKAPVYLRLTHDYQITHIATGVYLLASEWDQKNQVVVGKGEALEDASSRLKKWIGDAEDLSLQHRKNPNLTVLQYRALLLGQEERPRTLLAVADAFYQNKARPEMKKAFATLRRYRAQRLALEAYLSHHKALLCSIAAVDLAWLRRFERWCLGAQGYALSTTRKYVSYLQEVVDFAAHEQWLPLNPVAKYRFEAETPTGSDPTYLPEAQVQQLANLEQLPPMLERARVAWLFCCYTGLSYVDYYRFELSDLHTDGHGRQWVRMTRQKTGTKVSIPVLDELRALLVQCSYVVPKFDRTYLRRCMGQVGEPLGITQVLNSGLARHTASHRLRNVHGFTDEEAAAILGHSKEVQHSNYSRKREEGLTLALNRLGVAEAPSLLEQLRAALSDPALGETLRAELLKGLPDRAA